MPDPFKWTLSGKEVAERPGAPNQPTKLQLRGCWPQTLNPSSGRRPHCQPPQPAALLDSGVVGGWGLAEKKSQELFSPRMEARRGWEVGNKPLQDEPPGGEPPPASTLPAELAVRYIAGVGRRQAPANLSPRPPPRPPLPEDR